MNISRVFIERPVATTLLTLGLALAGVWIYALRQRFVATDMPPLMNRNILQGLLLPSLVFIISAVVAVFNAFVGMYLWFLLIPAYVLMRRSGESA